MIDILYPSMRTSDINELDILSHMDTTVNMCSHCNDRYSSWIEGVELSTRDLLHLMNEITFIYNSPIYHIAVSGVCTGNCSMTWTSTDMTWTSPDIVSYSGYYGTSSM